VKDRIADIERIAIHSQDALIRIMDKSGPLHNFADRDHCAQYVVAVALLYGKLEAADFEDAFATADPRIDELRAKTTIIEDPRYTKDFVDPAKRSSANAVQVFFTDGTHTPKVEVEYPMGHPKRRQDFLPVLRQRLEASLARRYPSRQQKRLIELYDGAGSLDAMPVHDFVTQLVS
jgi:2-methylcitrate dehydratase